jgi:hypothetical protein
LFYQVAKEENMRSKKLFYFRIIVVIVMVGLTGCIPTPTSPSAPCIATDVVRSAAPPDISSIKVQQGSTGVKDGDGDWCDPAPANDLKLVTYTPTQVDNLLTTYGCPDSPGGSPPACDNLGILAAVDVQPSNIGWSNNSSLLWPKLTYDLTQHPPKCDTCYLKIYQLLSPLPASGSNWRYVGNATRSSSGSIAIAIGPINHFSTFALVQFPPPTPLPGEGSFTMMVASEFFDDDQNGAEVAFLIREESAGLLETEGITRQFDFVGIKELQPVIGAPTTVAPKCQGRIELPAQLTCMFPIDTTVDLKISGTTGDFLVIIGVSPQGDQIQFNATDIFIY